MAKGVRIHVETEQANEKLTHCLRQLLVKNELVIVCIGTDRSTGDSLGPMVGTMLTQRGTNLPVYGTLAEPVHALNLQQTMRQIDKHHPDATVIAIDACLGSSLSIGDITLKKGPVKPGAGVNKKLIEVGDYSILAIVNEVNLMPYSTLQNTRLHMVWSMASLITEAILQAEQLGFFHRYSVNDTDKKAGLLRLFQW